jgi:hypothetical protein
MEGDVSEQNANDIWSAADALHDTHFVRMRTLALTLRVLLSCASASVTPKNASKIKRLRRQEPQGNLVRSEQGVDDDREMPHNLIPLLLTNTTLLSKRQTDFDPERSCSLTINSR